MNRDEIKSILSLNDEHSLKSLREQISKIKDNRVFFRGLLELSNICEKDCLYCGIRKSNDDVLRYLIPADEAILAARFVKEAGYLGMVIQSGEMQSKKFINYIADLTYQIKCQVDKNIRITLSCGEQSLKTYQLWKNAGADRYLLRIETSNPKLYQLIHPNNLSHSFKNRLEALENLRESGFQVGSGNMVGLPFQTLDDIADDLLFFKKIDLDMVGLGPYIPHSKTPLYQHSYNILDDKSRFQLALNTTAALRILMPTINIAAATALQTLDPVGREKALQYGANVIMPNITPTQYRKSYLLYEDKPCTDEHPSQCQQCLLSRVKMFGQVVALHDLGDSIHYQERL